jgi:TonB family protein
MHIFDALISAFLHPVILLSRTPLDVTTGLSKSAGEAPALKAILAKNSGNGSPEPAAGMATTITERTKFSTRTSISRDEPIRRQAGFGQYSPSGDKGAKPAKDEPLPNHDAQTAESALVSIELLGQYRLNVARSARPFKRYPSLAREKGWAGTVIVALAMPTDSGGPLVTLERSSGYDALDRQALEMVEQAARVADLPAALRGSNLKLFLPVEYQGAD